MGMGHAGPIRGRDEDNQGDRYFVNSMVVLSRNIFITAVLVLNYLTNVPL